MEVQHERTLDRHSGMSTLQRSPVIMVRYTKKEQDIVNYVKVVLELSQIPFVGDSNQSLQEIQNKQSGATISGRDCAGTSEGSRWAQTI